MRKYVIAIGVFASACTTGVPLKSVDYNHLFNDSNSKVWMVNKILKGNNVISSREDYDKNIMVFHVSGRVDYLPMKDVTRKEPLKGTYYLNSQNKKISIEFGENEVWSFDLKYLKEDSILMVPNEKSTIEFSFQLKPFPEL